MERKDTEFVRWGNGGEDPLKEGYSRSKVAGYLTAQQFAAFIGRNQGTARDIMSGRRGPALGKQIGTTWFISYEVAIEYAIDNRLTRIP